MADSVWVIQCKKHPRYRGKRQPRCACHDCWFMWFNLQGREYFGW